MTNRITATSPRIYARGAGFGLLLMFILAIFANFFVLLIVAVPGVIAELSLCLWLLIKGVKDKKPDSIEAS